MQVYNGNSEEYFCYECFEQLHSKGNRRSHRAMIVSVSDAEVVEPNKKCEECEDNLAAFRCDMSARARPSSRISGSVAILNVFWHVSK